MRGYPVRILGTLALVSAKERLLGLKTKRTACNKQGRPRRADWDALPIFIARVRDCNGRTFADARRPGSSSSLPLRAITVEDYSRQSQSVRAG